MSVMGIDHVNIVTARLDETIAFYTGLLGLTRVPSPVEAEGRLGAWLCDAKGAAIIHLVGEYAAPAQDTGALHHFALDCTENAGLCARVEAMGLPHRTAARPELGLRQIFLRDPNGVRFELNFNAEQEAR